MPQPDGSLRAYYPGEDWFVIGKDRADAIAKLGDEVDSRMQDPVYVAEHFAMTQRHLDGEVTPGFEARRMTGDSYEQRIGELGDRVRDGRS